MHPIPPKEPLRAYGDRDGDGMVQLSFVLTLPPSPRAREAAKRFAEMHGLADPIVATMETCAEGFSFFVVYGRSRHAVDVAAIDVAELRTQTLSREDIEHRIQARLGRKIVVVGACTGSDAHTGGIDAILNYKGYAGHKGLESYKGFDAHNLGAKVENERGPPSRRSTSRPPAGAGSGFRRGLRPGDRAKRGRLVPCRAPLRRPRGCLALYRDLGGAVAHQGEASRAAGSGGAPAVLDHAFDDALAGAAIVAGAAGARNGLDGGRPRVDGGLDLMLGDGAADTDVHRFSDLKIMKGVIKVQRT